MKKIYFSFIAVLISLAVGAVIGVGNAHAETVLQSMTVSPTNQRLILAPGETYTGSLKVSNGNSSVRSLKYSVMVGSFGESKNENSKDDYGVVDHITVSDYNQIMEWITLEKESGTVAPNETDVVTYTINVPENAPAGGQYATIIVRDETTNDDSNNGNVAIQNMYQFASVIFAEITGETIEKGEIIENSIPGVLFGGPITASAMVRNDGNVHEDAKYTLEIWPIFSNEEVYSNAEEPATSLVLPETVRYNEQSWDNTPMFGIFRVKQTVSLFDEVSTVEKMVIVCPLWLLFIIIFGLILIVTWLVLKARARKKRG